MLDKFLFHKIFDYILPQKIKENIVKKYFTPRVNNAIETKEKTIRFEDIKYDIKYIRLLIKDKDACVKLEALFRWGLDPHIAIQENYNLAHQVMYLYNKNEISFERAASLLNCLLKNKVSLNINLPINIYERKSKISDNLKLQNIKKCCDSKLMTFLLNNDDVKLEEKELLEYVQLKELVHKIQINKMCGSPIPNSFLIELENIIRRGYIFNKQNHIYHNLKNLFSIDDLENLISNMCLYTCYEKFSQLNIYARKILTMRLVNLKRDTIIFNLLSHGLNLNWSIVDKEGQESIVALEVLHSIPMIKMILNSDSFNICVSNKKGENILHLIGGLALTNISIKNMLNKKINQLTNQKKNYLLYQLTQEKFTPLTKAVYMQDELMIDFLKENGLTMIDEIVGVEEHYACTLNILDQIFLPCARKEKTLSHIRVDDFAHEFWQHISKTENSKKTYEKLNKSLNEKQADKKFSKI